MAERSAVFKQAFDIHFASSGLSMPVECLTKWRGGFEQNGWDIAYSWVRPRGAAVYMQLYASHRLTNDRIYCIHANGQVELVASVLDAGASDEEGRRALYQHNRAFEEERRRRGF